jgi:hypothetical protein
MTRGEHARKHARKACAQKHPENHAESLPHEMSPMLSALRESCHGPRPPYRMKTAVLEQVRYARVRVYEFFEEWMAREQRGKASA